MQQPVALLHTDPRSTRPFVSLIPLPESISFSLSNLRTLLQHDRNVRLTSARTCQRALSALGPNDVFVWNKGMQSWTVVVPPASLPRNTPHTVLLGCLQACRSTLSAATSSKLYIPAISWHFTLQLATINILLYSWSPFRDVIALPGTCR